MKQYGFKGLDIAPTRLFDKPYEIGISYIINARRAIEKEGLSVIAVQSIFYNYKNISLFKNQEYLNRAKDYTLAAIRFAKNIGARIIVFGSPKNRVMVSKKNQHKVALGFFKEVGDYAIKNNILLCIEPNPVEYKTNFINSTKEAIEFIKEVGSEGFRLNVDTGTIILNGNSSSIVNESLPYMSHLHISQPFLESVANKNSKLYHSIYRTLADNFYEGYVSIEMKMNEKDILGNVERALCYIKDIFEN